MEQVVDVDKFSVIVHVKLVIIIVSDKLILRHLVAKVDLMEGDSGL